MNSINFSRYLARFESTIGIPTILEEIGREMPISIREGKLYYSRFANFLGRTIDSDTPFVIDYYGYFKKSRGFNKYLIEVQTDTYGQQVKMINATVVIFNSIKLEEIRALTFDQYLLWGFVEFKETILDKRGLGNRRKGYNGLKRNCAVC